MKRQRLGEENENEYQVVSKQSSAESNSWYDEFHDPRFISLDMATICDYLRTFDNDCDIATFGRVAMNCALAGGILFERKGKMLDDVAKDWHTEKWSQWTREIEKMYFCLGFAVASYVPHPVYGGEPVVVNLERVEIKYHLDALNIPHFRVFEKLDMLDSVMLGSGMAGLYAPFGHRRMRNIKVWCPCPPYKNGRLRSPLITLLADLVYERHLLQTALIADAARARPPLVSQRLPEPFKSTEAQRLIPTFDHNSGGFVNVPKSVFTNFTTTSMTGNPALPKEPYTQDRNYQNAADVATMMNAFSADTTEGIAARLDRMLRMRVNNRAVEQVYIEDGRELVKQQMPEAPHEIILGFRQSRMVRVALMFGITLPALIAPARSSTTTSEVRKPGGKAHDEDGSQSQLFENHQRELRHRLIVYIREMYLFIHALPFLAERIRKAKTDGKPIDVKQTLDVTVSLPGQPSDEVLKQLYFSGCLKYKSYIDYISTKHCIPIECFESSPKLNLKELNGVQEKPPPAPGAK